ncbi:hypothetical protein Ac2012v2_005193 [Leucoagaricus gongylophorus]
MFPPICTLTLTLKANSAVKFHTQTNEHNFDTSLGKQISSGLQQLSTRFNLSAQFGIAPQDYMLFSEPYPSNNSLFSLFIGQVIPLALTLNNSEAAKPALFITNSGSLRFDLYAGPFTKNDQLTVSPFMDSFRYLSDVPLSVAETTVNALNHAGANERRTLTSPGGRSHYETTKKYTKGDIEDIYRTWLMDMNRLANVERRATAAANLTSGYVTKDSCPGVGDDVLHAAPPFFNPPDFLASDPPSGVASDTPIDFVFVDFIQDQLLKVVNGLQKDKVYTAADTQLYSPVLSSAVLGIYAQQEWN